MASVTHPITLPLPVIRLDPDDIRPLFMQLYLGLRDAIIGGRLRGGARLPASRIMATEYGVSRNTALAALEQLKAEGFITARQGAGSFVAIDFGEQSALAITAPTAVSRKDPPRLSPAARRLRTLPGRGPVQAARPFAPGVPDLGRLPLKDWSRIVARCWRDARPRDLTYGDPAGVLELREQLAAYLGASRAVDCDAGQIIITSGAQQGLDLCARVLLAPGDPVWFEQPGYPGARGALACSGANLIPVPVDEQGLDVSSGQRLCATPRLIYVSPSHQYPTGVTMSLARREALLAQVREHGGYIVEDDYDSEFRYDGRPLASLQGMDRSGSVIYVGTMSKVMFPSLRLGYLVLPANLVGVCSAMRAFIDAHTPAVTQLALAEFMRQGLFVSHLRRMRGVYAGRRECLLREAESLSPWLTLHNSSAGMHLAAVLKGEFDDQRIARIGQSMDLTLRPLSTFYLPQGEDPPGRGFLLGYAAFDKNEIAAAVRRLHKLLSHEA